MSGKLPIFNASALNDSTDIEKISSDSKAYAEEIDYLLEGEGVMSVKRSRYFFSPRSWLKSKGVGLRYVSRSRIIFIFFVLLIVQVTIFMLSEPTWIAIQPAMVTSDDELTALHTTEVNISRPCHNISATFANEVAFTVRQKTESHNVTLGALARRRSLSRGMGGIWQDAARAGLQAV